MRAGVLVAALLLAACSRSGATDEQCRAIGEALERGSPPADRSRWEKECFDYRIRLGDLRETHERHERELQEHLREKARLKAAGLRCGDVWSGSCRSGDECVSCRCEGGACVVPQQQAGPPR